MYVQNFNLNLNFECTKFPKHLPYLKPNALNSNSRWPTGGAPSRPRTGSARRRCWPRRGSGRGRSWRSGGSRRRGGTSSPSGRPRPGRCTPRSGPPRTFGGRRRGGEWWPACAARKSPKVSKKRVNFYPGFRHLSSKMATYGTGFRLPRCRLALEVGGVDLTLIPRRHHEKGLWRSKGLPFFMVS